jgi:hypothetical protein
MAAAYAEAAGRTRVPLEFPPYGSWFVVFRSPAAAHPATAEGNASAAETVGELGGPWKVAFPLPKSPAREVVFEALLSWTDRPEPDLKYFSGTATYMKTFDLPPGLTSPSSRLWLDLGEIRELAEVWLNDRSLGIVWAPPFRVDISEAVKPAGNILRVEVVNFWPNRIIGDQFLPVEKRFTRTNIRKLTKDTPLMPSGLLGPVTLRRIPSPATRVRNGPR